MNWQFNTAIDVDGVADRYIIVAYHRDSTRMNEKSKWNITEEDEIDCFRQSIQNEWTYKGKGYGFQNSNGIGFRILGTNSQAEELKIAKFVDDPTGARAWHGYPADYYRKAQDRPASEILRKWYNAQYITKETMSKIRAGKLCAL